MRIPSFCLSIILTLSHVCQLVHKSFRLLGHFLNILGIVWTLKLYLAPSRNFITRSISYLLHAGWLNKILTLWGLLKAWTDIIIIVGLSVIWIISLVGTVIICIWNCWATLISYVPVCSIFVIIDVLVIKSSIIIIASERVLALHWTTS